MRLIRWILTVGILVAIGGMVGREYGQLLARFSPDYLVVPSDWITRGWKLGFLAGTLLAAAQIVSSRPVSAWKDLVMSTVLIGIVALLVTGSFVVLFRIESLSGYLSRDLLRIRLDGLANPHRYLVLVGLRSGAVCGTLAGTLAACGFLWRRRQPD